MKSKLSKIWGVGLTIALLASLMTVAVPVSGADLAYSAVSIPGRAILGGFNLDFMEVAADGKTMFFYQNPTRTTTLVTAMKSTGGNFTTISAGDNITEIQVATNALGTLANGIVHLDGETIRLTSKDATNLIYTVVKGYTFRSDIDFDTDNKTQNAHVFGKAIKQTSWYTPGNVFSEPHDQGVAVASFGSGLYRSTNSGSSWSSRGMGGGLAGVTVVGLAISSRYATDKAVVAASATNVFYSTDGGATFSNVVPTDLTTKLEAGETISSVDIGPYWKDGKLNVVIGIQGPPAGIISNVLRFDLTQFGSWTPIGVMPDSVLKVAYSPAHLSDTEILAVTTNGTHTHLNTHFGQDTNAWNASFRDIPGDLYPVELNANTSATPVTSFSASRAVIAFGSDFSGLTTSSLLVGTRENNPVNDASGVIRVANLGDTTRKTLSLMSGNVSSIAISGPITTGNVLVGMVGSRTVSRTSAVTASSVTWSESSKHPTGAGGVSVVLWVGGNAVAGTIGNDAAYNISYDGGVSFNQLGAINVRSSGGMTLVDVAIIDANNMFVIMNNSAGGFVARSLFRTTDGGRSWVRVLTGGVLTGGVLTGALEKVVASANYTTDKTLYVIDGTTNVRKSVDSGNSSFISEGLPLPSSVSAIALVSKDDYFVGTSGGGFYRRGSFTSATGISGTVMTIALSPAFATDNTIVVGNDQGSVYISKDAGVTFSGLGSGGSLGGGTATVYVAIDPGFARNRTVYAASTDATAGLKRTDTNTGTWIKLLSSDNVSGGLAISPRGTLYVANNNNDGAVTRVLTPLATIAGTEATKDEEKRDLGISTMFGVEAWKDKTEPTGQLPWGAMLTDPELSAGRVLYVIAMGQSEAALTIGGSGGIFGSTFGLNNRLLTITDTLAPTSATVTGAPAPKVPAFKAGAVPALSTAYWADLSWGAISGAKIYQVRYSTDSRFPTDASVAVVYTVDAEPSVTGGVPPTTLTIGVKDAETETDIVGRTRQTEAGAGNQAPGTPLPPLKSGKTYYWAVRVTEPEPSPWSPTWSFYTALPAMKDPGETPGLASPYSPRIGEQNVSATPTFVWPTVKGATNYEFVIGEDQTFAIIDYSVNTGKLNTHATDPKEPLRYSTVYYWKVRATTDLAVAAKQLAHGGDWAVLSFTTMAKPEAAAKVEPAIIIQPGEVKVVQVPVERTVVTPQPIPSYLLWAIIAIGAVLIIALIILIVRTRRVT